MDADKHDDEIHDDHANNRRDRGPGHRMLVMALWQEIACPNVEEKARECRKQEFHVGVTWDPLR